MSQMNDGGPAFPGIIKLRKMHYGTTPTSYEVDGGEGMTLRDYFIAHAPAKPHPWFEPVMPEIGECPNAYKELSADDWEQWKKELPEYAPEKCSAETLAFAERHSEWQKKFHQWEKEREKQRYIQWPAAWADEMLKARDAK